MMMLNYDVMAADLGGVTGWQLAAAAFVRLEKPHFITLHASYGLFYCIFELLSSGEFHPTKFKLNCISISLKYLVFKV